jgi:ElaB/YqjD/DUF883 family membrane-anchored ribosome-binding protein
MDMDRSVKQNASGKVDARLSQLKRDIGTLQKDIAGLAGDVGDAANERSIQALQSAENLVERAYLLAEEFALDMGDRAENFAHDALESVRDSIRDKPLSAAGLFIGVGVILSALLHRR